MARKRLEVMDIRELLRQLRMGQRDRAIARRTGISRPTVAKYRSWAKEKGLLEGDLPEPARLEKLLQEAERIVVARPVSSVEPYREIVERMWESGISIQVIYDRLCENHGFTGSYSAVKRFVHQLKKSTPEAFIRIEVEPGAQAQVDFGYAGLMKNPLDNQLERAWAFVMTLSHSRHQFVQFVFGQSVEIWLRLHRQAFEFFGGVPREIVLDNLKAAIIKAGLYDPTVQRSYRECAEHYGFLISPCRKGKPEHKGKVECGGVKYVKGNFLPGQSFRDITDANEKALVWCMEKAGGRIHGTTKRRPLEVFEKVEKRALLPLADKPFEICSWKQCSLHPDCYVVFDQAYYSCPHRLIGEHLWVRATATQVEVFHEHKLVAVHNRAQRKGERSTLEAHLPPDKVAYLMQTPGWCRHKAEEVGKATKEFIERLLGDRPLNRLRTAQGVLRLSNKYGSGRLEEACKRALVFDEFSYGVVQRILIKELDKQGLPPGFDSPVIKEKESLRFVRGIKEFFPSDPAEEESHGDSSTYSPA